MNTSSHKENNSVGIMQKIAFGIGMLGNQMFPASLGIFIVILIQNLGFSPLLYGVIAFIPRFWMRTTIKIPRDAGNIWLPSIPIPNAIFCIIPIPVFFLWLAVFIITRIKFIDVYLIRNY